MKRALILFQFIFAVSIVHAADSVAVFPVGAQNRGEWTVAKDVDRFLIENFGKISGAEPVSFKELLSTNDRKALNKCREDLKCQQNISRKISKKVDFFLFTRLKIGSEITVNTYLFDRKYNRLESAKIDLDEFAEADTIADEIITYWNRFLKKHTSSSGISDSDFSTERKSKKAAKKQKYENEDSDYEEEEEDASSRSSKSRVVSVENLIMSGFTSYAEGNLKEAESYFEKAASRDVVAKKLLNNVQDAIKFTARGNAAIKAKNHEEAVLMISKAEKANEEITGLGVKYRAYSKDSSVERVTYLEPTSKDIQIVDSIHRKYSKLTEKSRKDKAAKLAEIDKWLNGRILERESKLKQFETDSKNAVELEKKEYADLAKKIKDLKYQWEKDDSEIEQKIVALENKLTLFEQKEKGVVKVSTEGDEKARTEEMAAVDKKYTELLKKMRTEKEQFDSKQKDELEKGSKTTEAAVVKLEEKKKANDAKIVEIDKKIAAEMEKFDAEEKKFSGGNEEVKMKNEDEDRKFKVQVEKEYQVKFDELNKKLQDFDQQESEKRKDLEKYDKAIEEYMTKNVELMSKFQEELEKERATVDAEYKTKKESATAEAEKKYTEDLAKLTTEKTDLEAKIAEKETPQLKKQLAAVEKKISAHESGKETFIADQVMKVDMEYEAKSMEIDTKLAKKNDELQKDNNKFRTAKLAEKKKAEGDFGGFQKRKDMFKKSIDDQIALAQRERDRKIEDRQKDRTKLSGSWDSDRQKRQANLDRKLKVNRDAKDRLIKDNEKIAADITAVNTKWENTSQDLRASQQTAFEKFDTQWKEKYEKTEAEYKEKKEAVDVKYAQKQVSEKEAQKQQKIKWEEEIQSLNEEKKRRKDERAKILENEKTNWDTKKKQWVEEEKQRKIDKDQFVKDMKKMNEDDRKEASQKRKDADAKYEESTKDIYQKEIDEISNKFREEYKITRTREVTGVKAQADIASLKAEALAKNGLVKLDEKDLLGARRAFAEALFLDKNNQIALDGMKSINISAKSMYWEAYGMRETNKNKAREIFTLLTKTLMPANEYFVKSRIALEDLN
ncbi:MAG TPA: hypothetical protein PKN76_05020 [bacterium]|nr:hypothetical protein [bacterium]